MVGLNKNQQEIGHINIFTKCYKIACGCSITLQIIIGKQKYDVSSEPIFELVEICHISNL